MRRFHRSVGPGRREEKGAVALMVAVSMVALLIAVAMVLDFGQARLDRQVNKAAADSAVAAGMRGMDGGTGDVYTWRGVCEAVKYLRSSTPALTALSLPTYCTDGSRDSVICDKDDPATFAKFEQEILNDGEVISVEVRLPFDAAAMAEAPEESLATLANDPGDPEMGGCDQIGVNITHGRDPGLGVLADADTITSAVRSVGRVRVKIDGDVAVALLILEQKDCQALAITSGGALGRILVKGFEEQPGYIHVDSEGGGSMCSSKPIIEGKNPGTCPGPMCGGIVANEAEIGGLAGQISTSATSNMSDGIPRVHSGPYPPGADPIFRPRMTRKLVDNRYLEPVRNAVVSDAGPVFTQALSGTAPSGYTTVGCNPPSPITQDKVFVNCSNFNSSAKTFSGTHIIFSGRVTANDLHLPNAERVYIVGSTSPAGLSVSGLRMHDHGSTAQCASPAVGEHRARLFIHTGQLTVGGTGSLKLCNTTVILMGGQNSACLPTTVGKEPTDTPCGDTGNGTLSFGGGAAIDWTGPNSVDGPATTADWQDLEDLAVWSETAGVHDVGGSGAMHMSGVFMVPNANAFKINGAAGQNVENSQYIVRKLWNPGNGQLTMRPDPTDVITFPILEGFELVR
jgi:hypothetical protein